MKKPIYARTKNDVLPLRKLEFWGNEHAAIRTSSKVEELCDSFDVVTDCKSYSFGNYAEALKTFNSANEQGIKAFIIGYIDVDGVRTSVATSDSNGNLMV